MNFNVHSNSQVTVYMIRHGEAEDTGGITGSGLNPNLTEKGKKQAKSIQSHVQNLNISKVFHSGMARTVETTAIAFKGMEVEVIENREFREIEHGVMEGTPGDVRNEIWKEHIAKELAKWKIEHPSEEPPVDFKYGLHPHPEKGQYLYPVDPKFLVYSSPAQAENYQELGKRVSQAMLKEAQANCNKVIAIVTHNAAMQVLIAKSLAQKGTLEKVDGLYPLHFEKSLIGNCAIAEFNVHLASNEIEFVKFHDEK